jgi:hypothetical protein
MPCVMGRLTLSFMIKGNGSPLPHEGVAVGALCWLRQGAEDRNQKGPEDQ